MASSGSFWLTKGYLSGPPRSPEALESLFQEMRPPSLRAMKLRETAEL